MKKRLFRLLTAVNNKVLPSYIGKDLTKLSKVQKAVIGYRYWAVKNSLD
ncbi:MAG: hypothetical protein INR69_02365 [Mucilaginibacter polytrichastri]|nr:hypothetical protein [Mucilaginibacter polytrichastri]